MFTAYSSTNQPLFRDRLDAARQLGPKLSAYNHEDCVVVALPRGGVPIAYQIARALQSPLFILSVRKLGSPTQPELAIGAITSNGTVQFNAPLLQNMPIDPHELFNIVENGIENAAKRQELYQPFQPSIDFKNKVVIIIDDGLATGMTMLAAIADIKKQSPRKTVVVVPVCAPETAATIRPQVDELICLHQPSDFISVGLWYSDFSQVSDNEVIALLQSANKPKIAQH